MPSFVMGIGLGLRFGAGLGEFVPPAASAPVNLVAPTLTGTAQVGQALTFSRGSWSGYPSPSYAYQLKRDGVNIAGTSPYTVLEADNGTDLTLEVTATNSEGSAAAPSVAVSITVAPAAPTNSVAPLVSGSNGFGDTLTTTPGTWSGYPASFTYAYQWNRDGVDIAGATNATYTIVEADSGADVVALVRATNTEGVSAWQPGNTVTVQTFAAASIASNPTVSGTAEVGSLLTATAGTASGNPGPTRAWAWLRDGTPIAGATASTYTLDPADVGAMVAARQTETNAIGSPAVATSAAVGPITSTVIPNAISMDGQAVSMDGATLSMEP